MATLCASSCRKSVLLCVRTAGPRRSTLCKAAEGHPGAINRRASLSLLLGMPAALVLGNASAAPLNLELEDHRSAYDFLRSIDQMRDSQALQSDRFALRDVDGMSMEGHKQRATESVARLRQDLKEAVNKKIYYRVSNDIRHQLGTLRYDLDALTAAKPQKETRKQALQLQDQAMKALEDLDLYARLRKDEKLEPTYQTAVAALEKAVAFVA